MVKNVRHTGIVVSDMDKGLRFYRDLLGLKKMVFDGEVDDFDSETITVSRALSAFPGDEDANGAWTLRVTDRVAQDVGTLQSWSLTLTSVSNATFIVNLGNVCVGFLAWLFLKERPAPMWFFAVILAIGGASALSLGGTAEGGASFVGDRIAIIAAISVSGYFLCSKLARRTLNGLETLFWLTLVEVVVGAIMVMAFGENFLPENLSGFAVPLFLGIVIHVVGQGLIITGLGSTPTSIAGVIILIQPVMAAAISWHLFQEPLTTLQAGGGMLILVAVWLAQRG